VLIAAADKRFLGPAVLRDGAGALDRGIKAAPYPSTRGDYQPPQQPREGNGNQGNGQRYPPMALNIAHEPDTVLLPARRPDLVIGAVFTETPLVGRDATIKFKSCSRAGEFFLPCN
jgi:hypothetical protein